MFNAPSSMSTVLRGFFIFTIFTVAVCSPAETPPRGWNSYDSYTWRVNETEFLLNCAAMAKELHSFGYEYCVVDYLWFQDDIKEDTFLKDPITKLHIDEFGRLVPAPDRWPSTVGDDGKTIGFKPIADKVHAMGMKFGIHIMRGISTASVTAKSPILGTNATAADIGLPSELCPWWKGVMAVNLSRPEGQAYYDSIYAQYADWGVDFIKNDCIFGNQFMPDQIKAQANSIVKTGREIVYSLSPGSDVVKHLDKAHEINNNVNMYRVTGDDWDSWGAVKSHFEIASMVATQNLIGTQGLNGGKSWPDLDMLPFGVITSPGSGKKPYRNTSLTPDQQYTQMTLWAIAKSPLFFGGDATQLDDFTLKLLSNRDVLNLNEYSSSNHQVSSKADRCVWVAKGQKNQTYVALFNTGSSGTIKIHVSYDEVGLVGLQKCDELNVWTGELHPEPSPRLINANVNSNGVVLVRLSHCV